MTRCPADTSAREEEEEEQGESDHHRRGIFHRYRRDGDRRGDATVSSNQQRR
jgi:hypothetical protein